MWIHGPFCGGEGDLEIARSALLDALYEDKMAEADGGYGGEPYYIKCPFDASSREQIYMKKSQGLVTKLPTKGSKSSKS